MTSNNNSIVEVGFVLSFTDALNPVNQAKRRLTDSEYFHPSSKRVREDVQCSPSDFTTTLSPIRINNSSKMIVNVTPTSASMLYVSFGLHSLHRMQGIEIVFFLP